MVKTLPIFKGVVEDSLLVEVVGMVIFTKTVTLEERPTEEVAGEEDEAAIGLMEISRIIKV